MKPLVKEWLYVTEVRKILRERFKRAKQYIIDFMDRTMVKLWQRALGISQTTRLVSGSKERLKQAYETQVQSHLNSQRVLLRKITHKKVVLARLTGDRSVLENAKEERANAAKKTRTWGRRPSDRPTLYEANELVDARKADAFAIERKRLKKNLNTIVSLIKFWQSRFISHNEVDALRPFQEQLESIDRDKQMVDVEVIDAYGNVTTIRKKLGKLARAIREQEKSQVPVEISTPEPDQPHDGATGVDASNELDEKVRRGDQVPVGDGPTRVLVLLEYVGLLACLPPSCFPDGDVNVKNRSQNANMIALSELLCMYVDDKPKVAEVESALQKAAGLNVDDQMMVVGYLLELEKRQAVVNEESYQKGAVTKEYVQIQNVFSNQVYQLLHAQVNKIKGHSTLELDFGASWSQMRAGRKDQRNFKQGIMERAKALHRQVHRMRAMNRAALVQQQRESGDIQDDTWQQLQDSMFNSREASAKAKADAFWNVQHLLGKYSQKLRMLKPDMDTVRVRELTDLFGEKRKKHIEKLTKSTIDHFQDAVEKLYQLDMGSEEEIATRRDIKLSMHRQKVEFTALIGREDPQLAREFILQMRDLEIKLEADGGSVKFSTIEDFDDVQQERRPSQKSEDSEVARREMLEASAKFSAHLAGLKKEFECMWGILQRQKAVQNEKERRESQGSLYGIDANSDNGGVNGGEATHQAQFLRLRNRSSRESTDLEGQGMRVKMKLGVGVELESVYRSRLKELKKKRATVFLEEKKSKDRQLNRMIRELLDEIDGNVQAEQGVEQTDEYRARRFSDLAAGGQLSEQEYNQIVQEMVQRRTLREEAENRKKKLSMIADVNFDVDSEDENFAERAKKRISRRNTAFLTTALGDITSQLGLTTRFTATTFSPTFALAMPTKPLRAKKTIQANLHKGRVLKSNLDADLDIGSFQLGQQAPASSRGSSILDKSKIARGSILASSINSRGSVERDVFEHLVVHQSSRAGVTDLSSILRSPASLVSKRKRQTLGIGMLRRGLQVANSWQYTLTGIDDFMRLRSLSD